ncbi:MAG: insulinase family protein, partial [Myxococcales bacterium]
PSTTVGGKLANGIRVLMVERHDLPVVSVRVVATRGAAQARPGVGSFAAATLMAGTSRHDADALSDAFEAIGAEHWASADYDAVQIGVKVIAGQLPTALDLLAEVAQSPTFPKSEVDLERGRRLASLAQERDRPTAQLQRTLVRQLYPATHPYATPLLGDEALVEKITRADLAAFHRAQFEPDRLAVVAAGDFQPAALIASLDKTLGTMKGKGDKVREVRAPEPPKADAARVVIVDRPGASQSNVSLAMVGVARKTPDYEALMLMNTILGGQFSSRLNLNLREKNGFTYGAGSSFAMRQGPGPFSTSGAIVREHTAAAVREILAEVESIRTTPVTEAELSDAREFLIRQLQAYFESGDEVTGLLAALEVGLELADEELARVAQLGL